MKEERLKDCDELKELADQFGVKILKSFTVEDLDPDYDYEDVVVVLYNGNEIHREFINIPEDWESHYKSVKKVLTDYFFTHPKEAYDAIKYVKTGDGIRCYNCGVFLPGSESGWTGGNCSNCGNELNEYNIIKLN